MMYQSATEQARAWKEREKRHKKMQGIQVLLESIIMGLVGIAVIRFTGVATYTSVWLFVSAAVFALACGAAFWYERNREFFVHAVHALGATLILMFCAVTYPHGFVALGWVAFYSLWYAGATLLFGGIVVYTLPYLGRLSMWESEHVQNEWLRRKLKIFAESIKRRIDRIMYRCVRPVLVAEYHVVNQYAKMYHSSELTRQTMFLSHIEGLARSIARRNGIAIEKEETWRR